MSWTDFKQLARGLAIAAALFALAYCQMNGVASLKNRIDGDDCPAEAQGIRC